MSVALQVQNLAKTFQVGFWARKVVAVRDVSFSVRRGAVFGIVGPNGAGKSTTLKMILGLIRPTTGSGTLLDQPLGDRGARARLGYLPELPVFPRYLTAAELLDFHARLAGVAPSGWATRRDELLARVGLGRAAKTRLSTFSKGMLQRTGLAVALCSDPELLILDEPMSGLDPLGRHDVRVLIRSLRAAGKTIVFSSHVLSDVEALCDDLAILGGGKVYRAGSLHELTANTTRAVEIRLAGVGESSLVQLGELGDLRQAGNEHLWELKDPGTVQSALKRALELGVEVRAVQPRQTALEDLLVQAGGAAPGEGRMAGA